MKSCIVYILHEKFQSGKLNETDHLWDLGVEDTVKYTLKKWNVDLFQLPPISYMMDSCEHGNLTFQFRKGEFLDLLSDYRFPRRTLFVGGM